MGEGTRCNYCTLRAMRKKYRGTDMEVTLQGSTVYVHPKMVKLTPGNKEDFFAAWFMELTSYCAC